MRFRAIEISRQTPAEELHNALSRLGIEEATDHHGGLALVARITRRQARLAPLPAVRLLPRVDLGGYRHA